MTDVNWNYSCYIAILEIIKQYANKYLYYTELFELEMFD